MRKHLRTVLVVTLLSLGVFTTTRDVCAADPAPAAPPTNPLKKKGDEAMDDLRFVEAIGHYRRAYEASQDPAILYNLGRAYEAVGDNTAALDALLAFESKAPPEMLKIVPGLAQRIADVRGRIVTLDIRVNQPGARIMVQRGEVGRSPLGPVRTNAGHLVVRVEREQYRPFQTELDTVGGRDYIVEANLVPDATTGVLVVRSPQVGAQVEIDGRLVGQAPLETVANVGERRIVLKKDGYKSRETSAIVDPNTPKSVDVVLEANSSVLSRWWFWTGVALVIAGGVALGVAATTERDPGSGSIPPNRVSGPLVIGF